MSEIVAVGTENFKTEVIEATEPVLVDFYADWCPPCKMLAPLFANAAQEYAGRVKFAKCDTDKYQELSESFGVGKIPNVMAFKNGQVVNQAVGYIGAAQLNALIEAVLQS